MFFITVISIALIIILMPGKSVNKEGTPAKTEIQADGKMAKTTTITRPKPVKRTVFNTNDEIRMEYGRLEKVYLWNGQSYIGAVIETKENYKMVTVDGLKVFSMSELKQREIIR